MDRQVLNRKLETDRGPVPDPFWIEGVIVNQRPVNDESANEEFMNREPGESEAIDPVFLELDTSLEFLIRQCHKILSAAGTASGEHLADALNYRDDLETALAGNPELGEETLARISEMDVLIGYNLAIIRERIDRDFALQMQKTYPARHWWWWAVVSAEPARTAPRSPE